MAQSLSSSLNWGILPLLVVAVAISFSIQLEKTMDEEERSPPPNQSDYFIRGARMSALGPHGELLYQVQAEEILHYPDRSATLTDMTLHYQGGPAGVWQLKAGHGRIPPGGGKVTLEGEVIIRGTRPNRGPTLMKMSEVELIPEQGLMVTEAPVIIAEPGSKVSAVGMQADILKDVISLSRDVQVRYAW